MTMQLLRPITKPIVLSFYQTQTDTLIGTDKLTVRALAPGGFVSFYFKEPSFDQIPKACSPGDTLIGTVTYLKKDNATLGCGTRPGGYEVKYIVGDTKPPAVVTVTPTSTATPTTATSTATNTTVSTTAIVPVTVSASAVSTTSPVTVPPAVGITVDGSGGMGEGGVVGGVVVTSSPMVSPTTLATLATTAVATTTTTITPLIESTEIGTENEKKEEKKDEKESGMDIAVREAKIKFLKSQVRLIFFCFIFIFYFY